MGRVAGMLGALIGLLGAAGHAQEVPTDEPAQAEAATETIAVEPLRPAPAESPPVEAPASATQLDEVVVTARRKQERAQDVPISLAVLDGDALGAANLTLPTDIQERVPGMLVSVPNARLTSYTIRGLGSSSANDGIESSVGLVLDGVYLARQGISMFDLVDLDRIEILRGPQGTLFGKNTTAGAINIVTKAPSQGFEANLEGTAANLGYRQLRGSINGPLVDGELAGRLTGYMTRRDGTIDNVFDGSELNARHKDGLRGQLLWTPAADLSARLIAEYGYTSEVCCAYPLIGPVRDAVQARDDYMEYVRPSLDPLDRLADANAPTHTSMHQKALALQVDWDFADRHRLVSISAWRNWYFRPDNDDATSLNLAYTSTLNQHRQLSQELRIDSDFDGVDTVVGLYLLNQKFRGRERVILQDDLARWVFGGLIRQNVSESATYANSGAALDLLIPPETLDGMTVNTPYTQNSDSVAAFGSANWHLSDRVDLTTGLRYTYEWKDAVVSRSRTGGNPSASPLSALDTLTPLGALIGVDLSPYTFGGLLDGVAGGEFYRETDYAEGNWSGQLALTYKLGPDTNVYGSVARGYKGGGINLGVTGASIQPTFKPEEATSWEAGFKSRFLGRFAFSFAAYYTDVENYQALTFDDEDTLLPNPRQTNLLNVGQVRLQGAEVDLYGYLLEGLMFRVGVAYSDAITVDFTNAPNEDERDNSKDLSGETLYNAPRWSGTAGLEYGYFLGWGAELYGALDYSFRTDYWGTVEHGRASYIEGYGITNLRLGLRESGRRWDLTLWTRNVLDEGYTASVYPLYGVGDYGAFAGDPRTYGATLRLNFL